MTGFDEEWLASHQSRMSKLRSAKPLVATPAVAQPAHPAAATQSGTGADEAPNRKVGLFSHVTAGVRNDIGPMHFKSAWEANYARYLNFLIKCEEIIKWEYEPVTFWFEQIKRGTRSYKPDFRVWPKDEPDYFVEVKGWMYRGSQTKLNRMKKYHPEVRVVLIGPKEYRAIARTASPLIPEWEHIERRRRE